MFNDFYKAYSSKCLPDVVIIKRVKNSLGVIYIFFVFIEFALTFLHCDIQEIEYIFMFFFLGYAIISCIFAVRKIKKNKICVDCELISQLLMEHGIDPEDFDTIDRLIEYVKEKKNYNSDLLSPYKSFLTTICSVLLIPTISKFIEEIFSDNEINYIKIAAFLFSNVLFIAVIFMCILYFFNTQNEGYDKLISQLYEYKIFCPGIQKRRIVKD